MHPQPLKRRQLKNPAIQVTYQSQASKPLSLFAPVSGHAMANLCRAVQNADFHQTSLRPTRHAGSLTLPTRHLAGYERSHRRPCLGDIFSQSGVSGRNTARIMRMMASLVPVDEAEADARHRYDAANTLTPKGTRCMANVLTP